MSNMIDKIMMNKVGVPTLTRFLDLASTRHKLIAGNMANVSTPGYTSKDIDFHGELKKAVDGKKQLAGMVTQKGHIPLGRGLDRGPKIIENKNGHDNGLNDVDIDKEMANMTQNQIYFSVGAKLLQSKFEGLRRVIRSR